MTDMEHEGVWLEALEVWNDGKESREVEVVGRERSFSRGGAARLAGYPNVLFAVHSSIRKR